MEVKKREREEIHSFLPVNFTFVHPRFVAQPGRFTPDEYSQSKY